MPTVKLRHNDEPIELTEIVRDDDIGIVGTNSSGKMFVARREDIEQGPSGSTPSAVDAVYRVYLKAGGDPRRVSGPRFEEAQDFLLNADAADAITFRTEDGEPLELERDEIGTLLSATPEAQKEHADSAPTDDERASLADDEAADAATVPVASAPF